MFQNATMSKEHEAHIACIQTKAISAARFDSLAQSWSHHIINNPIEYLVYIQRNCSDGRCVAIHNTCAVYNYLWIR